MLLRTRMLTEPGGEVCVLAPQLLVFARLECLCQLTPQLPDGVSFVDVPLSWTCLRHSLPRCLPLLEGLRSTPAICIVSCP